MAAARDQKPTAPVLPALHRPAEVARILRCSEWWVKEQARKQKIPFSWIGGSYRFTDEHVAEIVRLFEKRPVSQPTVSADLGPGSPMRVKCDPPKKRLKARTPRRTRNAARSSDAA